MSSGLGVSNAKVRGVNDFCTASLIDRVFNPERRSDAKVDGGAWRGAEGGEANASSSSDGGSSSFGSLVTGT